MILKIMVLVSGYFVGANCLVTQSAHAAHSHILCVFKNISKQTTKKNKTWKSA
jgi:hypothetical protein